MEVWREIPSFPGYSVSSEGRVKNDKFDRLVTLTKNSRGITIAGLFNGTIQCKRSVAVLVANEFLPTLNPKFDTPINLDGDRSNNSMFNLDWRPRWFAIEYFRQFRHPPRGYSTPIEHIESGEVFPNSWAAALRYGLLDIDIMFSIMKRTYAWPGYHTFNLL